MIRILIADDHPLVREGLKRTLKEESDVSVVCEAENTAQLLEQIGRHELDAVITDLSMQGGSALDVLQEIKKKAPELPIIILSMYPEDQFAVRAIRGGASAYLTKESAPRELVRALRTVVSGRKYITPAVAERLAAWPGTEESPHERLSEREFQIFSRLASGKSIKEIADELFISVNTVNTHRSHILEKMGLQTNIELSHYAIRNRLIQ
jgi:two-component system invasion response regulator UvrY